MDLSLHEAAVLLGKTDRQIRYLLKTSRRITRAGWDLAKKARLRFRRKLKGHLRSSPSEKLGRALGAFFALSDF